MGWGGDLVWMRILKKAYHRLSDLLTRVGWSWRCFCTIYLHHVLKSGFKDVCKKAICITPKKCTSPALFSCVPHPTLLAGLAIILAGGVAGMTIILGGWVTGWVGWSMVMSWQWQTVVDWCHDNLMTSKRLKSKMRMIMMILKILTTLQALSGPGKS